MAQMEFEYKGGFEFQAKSRNHTLTVDLPAELKGGDKGMTPPELLVASLASCVGMYALFYCNAQAIPTDGMKIVAGYEDAPEKPARIGKIKIDIIMPGDIAEEHRRPLMQMAGQCKVHNTICNLPDIEMKLAT